MLKYKVCVYAICKNEEQFVDRWMEAVGEADLVVVLDTGSTDRTVDKLRERGAVVHERTVEPWRFDTARNMAMDYIPDDVDICVSNDLDEVFEPGWRDRLEAAWKNENTRVRYWFAWSHAENGEIVKKYTMEKIHRRHGFRWVHPVHEVLEYSGEEPDRSVFADHIVLHHRPDPNKSRSQYLPLLELSAAENPEDDRTVFWLGREYVFKGFYDDGIRTLCRHLEMPSAVWDEERSASMRFIARAYQGQNNNSEARRWLYRAIAECPHTREAWTEMARHGYRNNNWTLVLWAVEKGLAITARTNSYLADPASWGYTLPDYGAIAGYRLGLYDLALTYADAACLASPGDKRLEQNRQLILLKKTEGRLHEKV